MATYDHFQKLKKVENLANPKKIGACLTCGFWKVEGFRSDGLAGLVALCVQPELKEFQLIVSGSSGCNRWEKQPDVSPNAEAYAQRHEEK